MSKVYSIILLSCAGLLGLGLGFFWHLSNTFFLVSVILLLGALASLPKKLFVLLLLVFVLGLYRSSIISAEIINQDYFGTTITASGYVASVEASSSGKNLVLALQNYPEKVLVKTSSYNDLHFGDQIELRGKLQRAKNSEEFNYESFLHARGIGAISYYPKLKLIKFGTGLRVRLFDFKFKMLNVLKKSIKKENLGLLQGVVFGDKSGLSDSQQEAFQVSGLSHVMAASGYNLTILASALFFTSYLWGRKSQLVFLAGVLISFAFLAGFAPSIYRALVMAFILLFAQRYGRIYLSITAVFLAAFFMVFINPWLLLYDVGFILSVLATIAVVCFSAFVKLKGWWTIFLEATIICAVVMIMVLPVQLYSFNQVNFLAPIANMLVVPIIPLIMLLFLGIFLPVIGGIFAFVVNWLLQWMNKVALVFSSLPFTIWHFQLPSVLALLLTIGLCGSFISLYFLVLKREGKTDTILKH